MIQLSLGELNQNLLATLRIQRMDENEVEFADRAFNGQILSIQVSSFCLSFFFFSNFNLDNI